MARIFLTLASLSIGLFLAAVVLGLSIGDLYDHPSEATLRWRGVHMLMGVAAALAVVFVHSIVITYFVGTSRWCKEVAETYQLDPTLTLRSAQLKRGSFAWSVLGMLMVVVVGALGAASDPGTGRSNTDSMASVHLAVAFAGFAVIVWTYFRAWCNIVLNQLVIQQVVDTVQATRQERGLDAKPTVDEASLAAAP